MLKGLNHITIAVSDLQRSLHFYRDLLGLTCKVEWADGAYLSCADLWLCLSVDKVQPAQDYTHLAFDVAEEDFATMVARLQRHPVCLWKENKSEGASLYLLDPDGHKLELHVGDLASRLVAMRAKPTVDMIFYE